ncbi:putative enterotoxin [Cordyceps sp. RAO-2017]|nr:putative enterotoxin [Cordyceps sp. RAO-2017]
MWRLMQQLLLLPLFLAWLPAIYGVPQFKALTARQTDSSPTFVYRSDTRSPGQIAKAGGFLPRGYEMASDDGFSVYRHMRGATDNGGGAPVDSVYVSTTDDVKVATRIAAATGGYVYKIHATKNVFSVKDTLKSHYLYLDQKEWVALGGVRNDQIEAVVYIKKQAQKPGTTSKGTAEPDLKFKPYKGYNAAKYADESAGPPQPQLAGFTDGHPAFDEKSWRDQRDKVKSLKYEGLKYLDKVRAAGWEPPYANTPRAAASKGADAPPHDGGSDKESDKARAERARSRLREKAKSKPKEPPSDDSFPEDHDGPPDDKESSTADDRAKADRLRRQRQKTQSGPNKTGDDSPPDDPGTASDGGGSDASDRSMAQRAKDWLRKKFSRPKKHIRKNHQASSAGSDDYGGSDARNANRHKGTKPKQKSRNKGRRG